MAASTKFVRARVRRNDVASLMRTLGVPTLTVEVPPSVGKLEGSVASGRVFWYANGKWEVARCLICFKSGTRLEMMLCEKTKRIDPEVKEVYIAPCRVVRRAKNFGTESRAHQQQSTADGTVMQKRASQIVAKSGHDENKRTHPNERVVEDAPMEPKMDRQLSGLDLGVFQKQLQEVAKMPQIQLQSALKNDQNLGSFLSNALASVAVRDVKPMAEEEPNDLNEEPNLKRSRRSSSAESEVAPANENSETASPPRLAEDREDLLQPSPNPQLPRWRPAIVPKKEYLRLRALRSLQILDTKEEEVFDRILQLATDIFDAEMGAISFVDANRQWFKARKGLKPSETPRNLAFCSHAILQPNKLTLVPNAVRDRRFAQNPLVTGDPKIRFYAGVPIGIEYEYQTIYVGTLCVISHREKNITEKQKMGLRYLASICRNALIFRRNNMNQQLQRSVNSESDTSYTSRQIGVKRTRSNSTTSDKFPVALVSINPCTLKQVAGLQDLITNKFNPTHDNIKEGSNTVDQCSSQKNNPSIRNSSGKGHSMENIEKNVLAPACSSEEKCSGKREKKERENVGVAEAASSLIGMSTL